MRSYTILHTEASMGWGGQEIRIVTESAGMLKRGHRVLLACRPGSMIAERAPGYGIETHEIPMGGVFDLKAITRLSGLIKREHVDFVVTHSSKDSWCAGFAAQSCRRAKVIRMRHVGAIIKPTFSSRLLYKILPDAVVTIGEGVRKHVIERTGVSPDAVISIPTGIDLEKFDPDKADASRFRKDIGVDMNAPLIGTIGMLRREKGHSYLIGAAAEVVKHFPEARFAIVGDVAFESPIKQRLTGEIAALGLEGKAILAGFRTDVPDVIASLDVYVQPSLSEAFGQVISQAFAMKKPVVGTKVGGIPEQVIEGKTGFLAEKENSKQLADGIIALLRDPDMARRMGENGRKFVEERVSIQIMLDRTEALYHHLIPPEEANA